MNDAPVRPTRADETKTERRRRRGDNILSGLKLSVDEKFLDRQNFEYRWINDDGGKIQSRTENDDWDLVQDPNKVGKQDADGLGSIISKVVGSGDSGQAMRAYLARKPKKFYDEDQADKRRSIAKTMEAIKRGAPEATGEKSLGASAYVPGGSTGITINDGRQS